MEKPNSMDIRKNLFKYVVADYDYARPLYPTELYDTIQSFSGINKASHILEVGAGTGQASELFIANNHPLDLLEVSDEQVIFLENKYSENKKVRVFKDYFEDFQPDATYDLIYSATAFHWIKCENGYPKAWNMLREGGTMAVFWNMFWSLPPSGGIFDGLNEIDKKYSVNCTADNIDSIKEKRIKQITVGGFFDVPEYFEFRWTEFYDAKKYAALMNTNPKALLLDDTERTKYLQEIENYVHNHGGIVEMPEWVNLYLVKKQGSSK